MPPAGQHELGAFAFAVACRRAGLAVAYLGMDVPLASWLRMARETAVPAIVLGAVTGDDAAAVNRVVEAIRILDRPPVCFTGGPASLTMPGSRRTRSSCPHRSTRPWPSWRPRWRPDEVRTSR